jgi:hypothetical protein
VTKEAIRKPSTTAPAATKCEVCGSPVAAHTGDEPLCWVCRRLKISAWRDADLQNAPQE